MAKGRVCPKCGMYMYAISEADEPQGSWVVYECTCGTCKHKEKVFESK